MLQSESSSEKDTKMQDQVRSTETGLPGPLNIKQAGYTTVEDATERDFEQKYNMLVDLLETVELRSQVTPSLVNDTRRAAALLLLHSSQFFVMLSRPAMDSATQRPRQSRQ